jgi:hypothetical protein
MKKTIIATSLAIMITLISFGQESDKKTKEKVADTKKEMADVDKSIEKAQKGDAKDYQQFKRETAKRLDKVDKSLADLDTRVAKLDAGDRDKFEVRVKNLKEKNKSLKQKLNDFKDLEGPEKLAEFQDEFQKDMKTLDDALDNFFEDNVK